MSQKLNIDIFVIIIVLLLPSKAPAPDVSQNSIEFQLNEYGRKFLDGLNELRAEDKLCDVTIIAGDKSFRAHKIVLSVGSPYFKAMFTNENMRADEHTITLCDLKAEAFEVIKNYIYAGRIAITNANVVELLETASYLQMTNVKAHCCAYMKKKLNAENCLGIKYIADKYSCNELLNYATVFILDAFEEVAKYDEFLELTLVELIKIVSDDALNATEDKVYEAVILWIEHKDSSDGDRTANLPAILQHVRFPRMQLDYLERVASNMLIKACRECLEYVKEAEDYLLKRNLKDESDAEGTTLKTRFKSRGTNYLFSIGGSTSSHYLPHVERYDPRIDRWTEVASMKSPRDCLGVAALNNVLYAVGGYTGELSYSSSTECYDPHTDEWTDNITPLKPGRILMNNVATLNKFLYVIGGYDSSGSILQSVVKYDPEINEWIECKPLRKEKWSFAVGILDGYIYVLGGIVNGQTSNTVERYDPTQNEWHHAPQMIAKRYSFGSAAHGHYLYVAGGSGEGDTVLNSAERYNSQERKWEPIPPMTEYRRDHRLTVASALVYAVGGSDSNYETVDTVEVYDPATDTWSKRAPMLRKRKNFGLAATKCLPKPNRLL